MTPASARRQTWLWAVGAVLLCGLTLLYALVDPEHTPFPRCPFLALTGWQCPGCGSQRAIHDLLHGHITQAWAHNAMLIIAIPILIIIFTVNLRPARWPRLHAALNSTPAAWTALAAILLWTLTRNLL